MKLRCGTLVTLLVTALSVFLGQLGKSEFKSHMTKRKLKKQETELMRQLEHTSVEEVREDETRLDEASFGPDDLNSNDANV